MVHWSTLAVALVLIRVLHVPTAWFGYCFAFGVSGYMAGTILCLPTVYQGVQFRSSGDPVLVIGRAFRLVSLCRTPGEAVKAEFHV